MSAADLPDRLRALAADRSEVRDVLLDAADAIDEARDAASAWRLATRTMTYSRLTVAQYEAWLPFPWEES